MNGIKYEYRASKLNDFLGLLAMGAAALAISISFAYQDPSVGQATQTESLNGELQGDNLDRVGCIYDAKDICTLELGMLDRLPFFQYTLAQPSVE